MEMVASQVNINNALSIGGWMSVRELTWLATNAREREYIVEFGSFLGRSTRALADNIKKNGVIWAVDPWNGDYFCENGSKLETVNTFVMPDFIRNLQDHIDNKTVIPRRLFSYSFSLPFKVDMVFIDGDHRYETVIKDINKAFSLVKKGGIISGHDYNHPTWPGVKRAVDELIGPIELEEQIWWTIKS